MAIARKCDRCGKLYEPYDDIELNGVPVEKIHTLSHGGDDVKVVHKRTYDLCQDCCLEFIKWMIDPFTIVIRNDLADGIENFKKVGTVLYVDDIPVITKKENGELEYHNQVNVDGADINSNYIIDNLKLDEEETENGL